jgi:hypothetical protein
MTFSGNDKWQNEKGMIKNKMSKSEYVGRAGARGRTSTKIATKLGSGGWLFWDARPLGYSSHLQTFRSKMFEVRNLQFNRIPAILRPVAAIAAIAARGPI